MKLRFSKMHGLGNDFVVIDVINQTGVVDRILDSGRIRILADRHFGIGFDQLLLVESAQSEQADFRYRIFNADGSEVSQCGNGARCFARFVRDHGLCAKDTITVETSGGLLQLHHEEGGLVTVTMGVPRFQPAEIPFDATSMTPSTDGAYSIGIDGADYSLGLVSLGNPHAVLRVDDIMEAPVTTLGAEIEHHPRFPERVNAGFMEIVDRNRLRLRVYERGVGETLACGSGACAAVVIGRRQGLLEQQVLVELPGGNLFIQWQGEDQPVTMTGPAVNVFEGEIEV